MRWYLPIAALAGQAALASEQPEPPQFDVLDERYLDYRPPGPDDVRSPCPALNCIANHGFIDRSGKNINLVSVIIGLFLGLGVSPETSGIIGAIGLASSHNPLTLGFDLDDLAKHQFLIEHDNSFARNDARVGDNNAFNRTLWNVALKELIGHDIITPFRMGLAKSARVEANKKLNPASVYGPRSAAFGALEAGLALSVLGSPVPGFARLDYLRSFFEEERLPYHLGWRPFPFACNLATWIPFGAVSLVSDPHLISHGIDIVLGTPSDLLQIVIPPELDFLAELRGLIRGIGFDETGMDELDRMLKEGKKQDEY